MNLIFQINTKKKIESQQNRKRKQHKYLKLNANSNDGKLDAET